MPTTFATSGGFISSAVPFLLGAAVLIWFLKSNAGSAWLARKLAAVRDHFWGAPELYIQPVQDAQAPETGGTDVAGVDVDDFDYDIYDPTPAP